MVIKAKMNGVAGDARLIFGTLLAKSVLPSGHNVFLHGLKRNRSEDPMEYLNLLLMVLRLLLTVKAVRRALRQRKRNKHRK
jgi:hypothetical protein